MIKPIEVLKPFNRNGSFPLETHTTFASLKEAEEYAAADGTAYDGQLISVIENGVTSVYVVSNKQLLSVVVVPKIPDKPGNYTLTLKVTSDYSYTEWRRIGGCEDGVSNG